MALFYGRVTLLQVNGFRGIFGADVERGTDKNTGWDGIIYLADRPSLDVNFVKIPHHGAESGYHKEAWDLHNESGKPATVATPYTRLTTPLPTPDDIDRYIALSDFFALSTNVSATGSLKKHYNLHVANSAERRALSWKVLEVNSHTDCVRLRFDLDGKLSNADGLRANQLKKTKALRAKS